MSACLPGRLPTLLLLQPARRHRILSCFAPPFCICCLPPPYHRTSAPLLTLCFPPRLRLVPLLLPPSATCAAPESSSSRCTVRTASPPLRTGSSSTKHARGVRRRCSGHGGVQFVFVDRVDRYTPAFCFFMYVVLCVVAASEAVGRCFFFLHLFGGLFATGERKRKNEKTRGRIGNGARAHWAWSTAEKTGTDVRGHGKTTPRESTIHSPTLGRPSKCIALFATAKEMMSRLKR